jgi:hypothetical protein
MALVDEWKHRPTAMAEAFQTALGKQPKGNSDEVIDYTNLTVGEEVISNGNKKIHESHGNNA